MKKIIAVVSLVGLAGISAAQEPPTKQLSIQQANQLNGTPKEPTINGKPYSQYKAEQEALKNQQAAKPAAHMANIPKGLSIAPNTVTEDPAIQRMNEQVKNGMPQKEDTRVLPPVTDEKFVNNQTTKTDAAPVAFKMPTQDQFQVMGMNKPAIEATQASNDPSSKQSPSNVVAVADVKPVTESKMTRTETVIQEKEIVTQKPDATYTQATPQVPEQFKLSSSGKFGDKPATNNKQIAAASAQQDGGGIGNGSTEASIKMADPSAKQAPSNVVTPDAAKPLQDSKMIRTDTKPAPIEASLVKSPAKDAVSSSAANNNGPAGNSTTTAPAVPQEQSKQTTEKPAKQD
ncbi:MAG TPA: hypothetical protein VMZ03_02425 [Chitinophagaceae bacterium]|nr:hypothetical protein [Chitinophagaceae bacterium]